MTREEAKEAAEVMKAYAEGKVIQCNSGDGNWRDNSSDLEFGFDWLHFDYRIKPTPKKRLMTREEVLGFVANTPGIVASGTPYGFALANQFDYMNSIEQYKWATISPDGKLGEFQLFEIEE
jgi:hypothetical protein